MTLFCGIDWAETLVQSEVAPHGQCSGIIAAQSHLEVILVEAHPSAPGSRFCVQVQAQSGGAMGAACLADCAQ